MVQIAEVARLVKLSEFESRNLFKKQFTDDIAKIKNTQLFFALAIKVPNLYTIKYSMLN